MIHRAYWLAHPFLYSLVSLILISGPQCIVLSLKKTPTLLQKISQDAASSKSETEEDEFFDCDEDGDEMEVDDDKDDDEVEKEKQEVPHW